MKTRKKVLGALVGGAFCAGTVAWAPAHALEAKVSGQINRAILSVDDGTQSEIHNVDSSISSTRARLTGSAEIMPGIKAGILLENEYQSNPSNKVTQTAKSVAPVAGERHANVYFTGNFGYVSFGQGDGAANGGTEVDLSGTTVAQWAGVADIGGAMRFRNSTTIGPSIGQTTSQQDFESRYDRLRYDTPTFGPVKLALSTGIKDGFDTREAALWYSSKFSDGSRLAGALGMSKQETATSGFYDKTRGGSISWLSSFGLSVSLSTSKREINTTRDGKFRYVKVGYKSGQHAFSVDHAKADDQNATGDTAKVAGLGYVYKPVKWAEIYAAYKLHSLDRPGSSYDDIKILMVGSRLKF